MKKSQKQYLYPLVTRGNILTITIWVLVLFTVLAAGIYKIVSGQIMITKRVQEWTICPYLAETAFFDFTLRLKDDLAKFNTLPGQKEESTKELGEGSFSYNVTDEDRKININIMPEEVLAKLPGFDDDLARRVFKTRQSLGGKFYAIEEMLLVEGVDIELYKKIMPYITVYGDGKVNINTATPEVMEAIGLSKDLIASLIDYRAGPDGEEGTEDDRYFESVSDSTSISTYYISESQRTGLLNAAQKGLIKTVSGVFTLNIQTKLFNRPGSVYNIITDGFSIKRWIEK